MGPRIIDLSQVLGISKDASALEIANQLKMVTWS